MAEQKIGKAQPRYLLLILAAGLVLTASSCADLRGQGSAGDNRITRADPRFERLFAKDAKLEKIADGFRRAEGPVWSKKDGYLLFSDILSNSVFKWQAGKGVELFLKSSGYSGSEPLQGLSPGSNGLAFDSMGRLVLCEQGDRRVTRLEPSGRRTVLTDRYAGKRLNSPNDLVFNSNGDLYFTDLGRFADPGRQLKFSGVYRLSVDGDLTLLTNKIVAPNGIAFSPSEKTIYISNSDLAEAGWLAYDVAEDGTLINGRIFSDTPAAARTKPGVPDGLKVDRSGNVFATGPGGVHVFASDGTHLGSIEVDGGATNVAWGNDGSVLYVTGSTAVYRIQTLTKGIGF